MKNTLLLIALIGLSSFASTLTKVVRTPNGEHVETLAHPSGLSRYVFDLDQNGTSACSGTCAEKWAPYLLTKDEVSQLTEPLGSIARANGLHQLTINSRPVYLFFKDRVFSDGLGDGLGRVWHLVRP